MTRTARLVIAIVTSLSMACGGRGCSSGSSTREESPSNAHVATPLSSEQIDSVTAALVDAATQVPRDTFDPAAIVDIVGRDPATLCDWVRNNTVPAAYQGALRGPTGVLLDRIGNSLDRSLLLAELLRIAGHPSRLARARADQEAVNELAKQMANRQGNALNAVRAAVKPGPSVESVVARYHLDAPTVVRILDDGLGQSQRMWQELSTRANRQSQALRSAVGSTTSSSSRDLADAGDHWWVQVAQGSTWIDFDPLRPGQPATAHSQPEETFAYDRSGESLPMPKRFLHEVEVRVVVEQWKSGALSAQTVLAQTIWPAETPEIALRIEHAPLQWPKSLVAIRTANTADVIAAEARDVKEWLPILSIGQKRIPGSVFDTSGEVTPYRPGQSPVSLAPASPLGGGFDALSGGPDTASEGQLTAEWIEYEIRVPGRKPQVVRRVIFDVLGGFPRPTASAPNVQLTDAQRRQRGLALLGTIQVLPTTSRLTSQFVEKTGLEEAADSRAVLQDIRSAFAAGTLDRMERALSQLRPSSAPLMSFALARFTWSAVDQDAYIDQPNLVSFRTELTLDKSGQLVRRFGFDVVANHVAVWPRAGVSPFSVRVTQGIVDTNLEALMVGAGDENAGTSLNATLDRAGAWVTVRSAQDLGTVESTLTPRQRALVREELESGCIVVLPAKVQAPGGAGWWRIDPATGDTLGIGPQGWGQASVETVIKESLLAVLSGFAVGGLTTGMICSFTTAHGGVAMTPAENSKCMCAALAGGAAAGAFVAALPFLFVAPPAATAAGVATLKTFQIGTGGGMALLAMLKEGLCAFI